MFEFLLAAALAAQAQHQAAPQDWLENAAEYHRCDTRHRNTTSLVHIRRVGPRINSSNYRQESKSDPGFVEVSTAGTGNGGKVLGYTRLMARFVPCDGEQRSYVPEKRDPLLRYFIGKETHKTMSLTTRISPLDVKATATLARFDRLSGRKGEEWTTSIENDRVLLPYFRVDLSSTIDLESEVLSTREYNSSIVASSFEVVEKAAALIAPSTVLITAENRTRFNDAANFIDSSVSGLLRVSITERLRETAVLREGSIGETLLATITLVLPRANDAYPSVSFKQQTIGQWEIYAERVRPSLFGDPRSGRLPKVELSAASILNFLVADNKTLREALAGAASVTSARDALIKAPTDAGKGLVLCRAVSAEADRLGLAPVDASAAAWAFLADMATSGTQADKACGAATGLEYYPS